MNKMDLNMAPDTAVQGSRGGRLAWLKRAAIFAAPLVAALVIVLVLVLMIVSAPRPQEKTAATHPPAVQFAIANARPTTIAINVQGEARPRFEAALAAQVAGRIVWVSPNFAEGGAFREGDVIARVDPADYQLAVVRARSQVAQAQEALTREEAESELARQDWAVLGRGDPPPLAVREPQLAQARAQLAAAGAALRAAELDLSRTNIRAPFTGRMRERRANVGDFVAPGAPVAVMFSTDTMEIRVPLTDADLAALRTPVGFAASEASPGPAAHINIVMGGRILTWEGRLVRTEASVDARTRLIYGTVEVRDPFNTANSAPLAPGMFVTVRLEGSSRETLVAAPRSALKRNELVYVINEDNTIDVRQVRPAQTTADEVLFREGVADGERVVVSHIASARQGMAVTPINRAGEGEGEAEAAAPAAQQEPLDIRD